MRVDFFMFLFIFLFFSENYVSVTSPGGKNTLVLFWHQGFEKVYFSGHVHFRPCCN